MASASAIIGKTLKSMTAVETIFNELRHVKGNTVLGLAVQQGLKRDDSYAAADFLVDLKSQANDNPKAVESVIGKKAFKKLMAWHP